MSEDDWLESAYEERYEDNMEAIPSGEVFPNVELKQGEPPKFIDEGHEACVYYPAEDIPDNRGPEGGFLKGPLVCADGFEGAGGFYSEDYVRDLKHKVHEVLAFFDMHIQIKQKSWSGTDRVEPKYIPANEVDIFMATLKSLRELTR